MTPLPMPAPAPPGGKTVDLPIIGKVSHGDLLLAGLSILGIVVLYKVGKPSSTGSTAAPAPVTVGGSQDYTSGTPFTSTPPPSSTNPPPSTDPPPITTPSANEIFRGMTGPGWTSTDQGVPLFGTPSSANGAPVDWSGYGTQIGGPGNDITGIIGTTQGQLHTRAGVSSSVWDILQTASGGVVYAWQPDVIATPAATPRSADPTGPTGQILGYQGGTYNGPPAPLVGQNGRLIAPVTTSG